MEFPILNIIPDDRLISELKGCERKCHRLSYAPICLDRLTETKNLIITLQSRDLASRLRDSGVGNAVSAFSSSKYSVNT